MAIFGFIEIEDIVQVDDRTRLSAVKTYISKDEAPISLVRIEPEAAAGFITVSGVGQTSKDWFVDWQYSTPGTKTISLEVTTSGAPQVFTRDIEVITEADDMLWSKDTDLTAQEPDVLKWVPSGRNTFTSIHRASQTRILDWLSSIRVWRNDGSRLEKQDMMVTEDVKQLSTYWTLQLIFEGISNKADDVFASKAKEYRSKVTELKSSGRIQADINQNQVVDDSDGIDNFSYRMVRR